MEQAIAREAAIEAIRTLKAYCGQYKVCDTCPLDDWCTNNGAPCEWTDPSEEATR